MKVKCNNCGCEFDSKFCPECGTKRPEIEEIAEANTEESVRNDNEAEEVGNVDSEVPEEIATKDEAETSGLKVAVSILVSIVRWAIAIFILIFVLAALSMNLWGSVLLLGIASFLTMPLSKRLTNWVESKFNYKISKGIIIATAVICFFVGMFIFSGSGSETVSSTDNVTADSGAIEVAQNADAEDISGEISSEETNEVRTNSLSFDKTTQKKVDKIKKYISKGKFEKANELISKYDLGTVEKTYVTSELYLAKADYKNAAQTLMAYCENTSDLSGLNDDALYITMLEIKDKAAGETEKIDQFAHKVRVETLGYEAGHDWVAQTCTEPKMCVTCGETIGLARGHIWEDADCTNPKRCKDCDVTEGEPLGHQVDKWKVIENATCSEEGLESGVCSVCEEEVEQKIERTEHRLRDPEILVEATDTSVGKRQIVCKDCEEIVSTETYTLSADEKIDYYKKSCESVTYDDLIRYPEKYEGKKIKITVKITEVETVDSWVFTDQYEATMNGKYLSIMEGRDNPEPKFRPGDRVTIYGEGKGYNTRYTYRKGLILGIPRDIESEKCPCVKVIYAKIN